MGPGGTESAATVPGMADRNDSDRALLRRAMRVRRRALPSEVRDANAVAVAARALGLLASLDLEGEHRRLTIAATVADDGELDPGPLVDALAARGARIVHPRVGAGVMSFASAASAAAFVVGPGRVLQPDENATAVPLGELDVVLVPLVAFDARCNRVGRGGGHYDRTFARRREPPPLLVGLAHDEQLVADAAPEAHDVALDHIVTPARVFSRVGT